jgi:hypothetical protein
MLQRIRTLRRDLNVEFGLKARLAGALGGLVVARSLRAEQRRLLAGQTWEPPTFFECNRRGLERVHHGPAPRLCSFVEPRAKPPQPEIYAAAGRGLSRATTIPANVSAQVPSAT